jgi:hypothetical protein
MAALSIQVPYPVFYDRDGQPLDNGNIYIGVANLDPVTNPIPVYYDDALTITASQPLKTSNGYVYRNGTPAQLYVNATDFSITVNDSKNLLVYNFPEGTGIGVNAAGIQYDPQVTGGVATTVQDKLAQYVSVIDFGAVGDGIANDTAAIQAALNAQGSIYIPDGTYKITADLTIQRDTLVQFGQKAYFKAGANNITFFKSNSVTNAYATQIHNAHLDGNGYTNVVGFDMYNFRLNAGLFNPFMTGLEVGIIFRYGCFGTPIFNPATFDDVPFPIRIMDNNGEVAIINPNFDNTGNATGSSIAIDIEVGATIFENIGCSIQGGYCQGFDIGVKDTGFGTKINGTYFELCATADVLASAAQNSIYTGTQHWAGVGAVAIKGTGSNGITVTAPLMGSGNRSVGLLDFDGTNANCVYISPKTSGFKNTPIGVITGVSFQLYDNNVNAEVITASKGFKTISGTTATVTATATTLFTMSGANRGRYDVVALIANSGGPSQYTAAATAIWDGSGARIISDDGSGLTLTLSGGSVQGTQTTGSNQNLIWSYTYQPT